MSDRPIGTSSHPTTEITAQIKRHFDGELTEEALVEWLLNHRYAAPEVCPHAPGTVEWYVWVENQGYQAGTWDEVLLAVNKGLLSWDTVHKVNDALERRGRDAGGSE